MTSLSYEVDPPDYDSVPYAFRERVCACGGRAGFTNPVNWPVGYAPESGMTYKLAFNWWVCSKCLKPAPLNALNARLIRECELCESPYLINHWPDRNNMCQPCKDA